MGGFKTLDDISVRGKRVLVRVDLNVPLADGKVSDFTRIDRIGPTVRELASAGARIVLISHFGRPKGKRVEDMSLRPVAAALADRLGIDVEFADDCIGESAKTAVGRLTDGAVVLLENLRFHPGEEQNDRQFAAGLAELGDLYVNDAFSAAHRAHASTTALAQLLPAAAGRLMEAELKALAAALHEPARPLAAIVGGAKVSTKLALLGNLIDKVDQLVVGGGMANTFLLAKDFEVGASLCEADLVDTAREILTQAGRGGCEIVLPRDVIVAPELAANVSSRAVNIDAVPEDQMILDIGPVATEDLLERVKRWRTLVWNGPLGAFETPPFERATLAVARAVAERSAADGLLSVAGGGDTVAALNKAGVIDKFSYVSTAGGAFLEWLEGKELPGVRALQAAGQA